MKARYLILAMLLSTSANAAKDGIVDVNAADAATLEAHIMGIGAARAALIVAERAAGPFKNCADLVERVKGVGPATCAKNTRLAFGQSQSQGQN